MFCSPVCKVRTLLLLIFFSSNFMVPKLPVTHLRVAVPIKIELRLFRSKTVCSYNVLLSCLQSADRHSLLFGPMFVNNFSRQILLSHSVFSIFYYIYIYIYGQDSYNQMQLLKVFDPSMAIARCH